MDEATQVLDKLTGVKVKGLRYNNETIQTLSMSKTVFYLAFWQGATYVSKNQIHCLFFIHFSKNTKTI